VFTRLQGTQWLYYVRGRLFYLGLNSHVYRVCWDGPALHKDRYSLLVMTAVNVKRKKQNSVGHVRATVRQGVAVACHRLDSPIRYTAVSLKSFCSPSLAVKLYCVSVVTFSVFLLSLPSIFFCHFSCLLFSAFFFSFLLLFFPFLLLSLNLFFIRSILVFFLYSFLSFSASLNSFCISSFFFSLFVYTFVVQRTAFETFKYVNLRVLLTRYLIRSAVFSAGPAAYLLCN
jgi:hypothetical protein